MSGLEPSIRMARATSAPPTRGLFVSLFVYICLFVRMFVRIFVRMSPDQDLILSHHHRQTKVVISKVDPSSNECLGQLTIEEVTERRPFFLFQALSLAAAVTRN